ncbi:hypothetical protein STEG23_026259, partial [Scotinomys teguina]
ESSAMEHRQHLLQVTSVLSGLLTSFGVYSSYLQLVIVCLQAMHCWVAFSSQTPMTVWTISPIVFSDDVDIEPGSSACHLWPPASVPSLTPSVCGL